MKSDQILRFKHINRETKLLLLLSRVGPDRHVCEKAQDIIDSSINWDIFTSLSIKHGMAGIVYKNMVKLNNIPQYLVDKFRGIYNNLLRSNILKVSELDRIIDMLNKKGIDMISLKGAATAEKILGDIGSYPSDDIDILVKVRDIDKVRKILEADGYKLNDAGFDEYKNYFIKELYHINLSKRSFTVEPHWNLFMRYFVTPPEFWWKESITVSSGDREYKFLSPEKNVLYTSFRLFSKGFGHFRFLVLMTEIIRYYKDNIDWHKLFEYARRYKFENVLRVTMKMAHDLLGAPVAPEFAKLSTLRTRILYRRALRVMLSEGDLAHPLDKAAFAFLSDDLAEPPRVLLRRMFPDIGEIIARYRLTPGSGKAILYYLLNPILLMMRKHQK